MTTQRDAPQPIEVITTSDFIQTFVMLLNSLPFDLTGLTEVVLNLIENDNKTISAFKLSTSDIALAAGSSPKQGLLTLTILAADMATLKITNGKDLDFICSGPWGNRTFRAQAALSVKMPSTGS
jgi:hypothetical protein